jgi:alkylhydroperoxidase family enzyme
MHASRSSNGAADAFVRMIGFAEAQTLGGPLAENYARMRGAMGSRPAVYTAPTGDAPNIVRCHSLEPEGMAHAFGLSSAIHWGDAALPWATRELINTVTSRANNCFY